MSSIEIETGGFWGWVMGISTVVIMVGFAILVSIFTWKAATGELFDMPPRQCVIINQDEVTQ